MAMTEASPVQFSYPPAWPVETDWSNILGEDLRSERFQSLQSYLADERRVGQIFPQEKDVFNAFRLSSFEDTKVVILGQDPYHGTGQAHGLSFSVPQGCPFPPSLKNVFLELVSDLGVPYPEHGNLTQWARQGVLLLNTVLTVREGTANSHANRGWETFTDSVIRKLGRQSGKRIVFVLWGKPAEKKSSLIAAHHARVIAPHPSPLSAYRGFLGSRPFSRANQHLIDWGVEPVDWSIR